MVLMYTTLFIKPDGHMVSHRTTTKPPDWYPSEDQLEDGEVAYRLDDDEELSDYVDLVHSRLHELEMEENNGELTVIDKRPEHAIKDVHSDHPKGKAFKMPLKVKKKRVKAAK